MERFVWIVIAGALGSGARYLVSSWALHRFGTAFPWGTLIVNVVGCFAMCVVMELAIHSTRVPDTLRFALTTGFMGGLTTYSSFNQETLTLRARGDGRRAAIYFASTFAGCFAAAAFGVVVARLAMR